MEINKPSFLPAVLESDEKMAGKIVPQVKVADEDGSAKVHGVEILYYSYDFNHTTRYRLFSQHGSRNGQNMCVPV